MTNYLDQLYATNMALRLRVIHELQFFHSVESKHFISAEHHIVDGCFQRYDGYDFDMMISDAWYNQFLDDFVELISRLIHGFGGTYFESLQCQKNSAQGFINVHSHAERRTISCFIYVHLCHTHTVTFIHVDFH